MTIETELTRDPSGEGAGAAAPSEITQKPPFFEQDLRLKSRSKSSLRIRYEAETEVIRRKLGTLESIRGQLGISQRKMCQLLLVDPSAWSRWVREDEDAPPHIYRMLQWYLALQDKYPALDVGFWLSTVSRDGASTIEERVSAGLAQVHGEQTQIKQELAQLKVKTTEMAGARSSRPPVIWLIGVFALMAAAFALGRWTSGS